MVGNAESETVANVTPLEMWICCDWTESAFDAVREKDKLTVRSGGGQAAYEDRKFAVANAAFPNRWGASKNLYLKCVLFRKESQKIEVPIEGLSDGSTTTLWAIVEKLFLEHGDFTGFDSKSVRNVALAADALTRVLKDIPHGPAAIADILLLMVLTYRPR